jgi:hypothetical protein
MGQTRLREESADTLMPLSLRRPPFSLPYQDQLPLLTALVRSDEAPVGAPRDSARFVSATLHHRVAGYVVRALERERVELPRGDRELLARHGAIQLVHSGALRQELAEVEPVLREACGVAPVCVKGPGVADTLYPDHRLRPFSDLDLVVPEDALERGAEALRACGYEEVEEFHSQFARRHGHDRHMRKRIGIRTVDVELHWRVGDDPTCAALNHPLLSSSTCLTIAGAEVHVPPPAEQLVCLAAHLLSDRTKRLIWVQDLTLAARSASAESWRQSFELADRLGLGWVLHRALDYAARHLGLERDRPLPAGAPPPWGPLRAVEELNVPASLHFGRLAALGGLARVRYLREVLLPTGEGLRGTVGQDGAGRWRLAARHVRSIGAGIRPRR